MWILHVTSVLLLSLSAREKSHLNFRHQRCTVVDSTFGKSPARMLLISKNTCGGASWGVATWAAFCVLVKWITPSRPRGTASIYGSEKRLAGTTRGYSDLSGSPGLRKRASASPNQRFCLDAVLTFFISKASLLLMTHLPCLITGSSFYFPPSDCRISPLRTPFNEMNKPYTNGRRSANCL